MCEMFLLVAEFYVAGTKHGIKRNRLLGNLKFVSFARKYY